MTNTTILLDLDGTLTDPQSGVTRCIGYALERLGRPVPEPGELLWCIGPPLKESLRRLLGDAGSEATVTEALRLYRERYDGRGKFENRVYPGIPETLTALSQSGARLFMATAKPIYFAGQIAAHFGLAPYFQKLYGSELDGTHTDKKSLIAHIMAEEHLDPATTIMVGDRSHDIVGARHNGIRSIGVTYGYGSAEELTRAGADLLVESPEALPTAAAELLQAR